MTTWYVSCDESSVEQRYMVIGGIWCNANDKARIQTDIDHFRSYWGLDDTELKWAKVSKTFLPIYRDFIDLFFAQDVLRFRCIVVDQRKVNNHLWNNGDGELAFYKFYYYMLLPKIVCGDVYYIHTDQLTNREGNRLAVLQRCLNKTRKCTIPPVRAIEAHDSKANDFIQLTDLLIGAIQADWNQNITSPAKLEFVKHVLARVPFSSFRYESFYWKFEMFVWKTKAELEALARRNPP